MFVVGSFVQKAQELQLDTPMHFFLFKVVIGRAYCHKGPSTLEKCPEGYDSVYLQPDQSQQIYSHRYLIYNPERVTLIHQIQTKIRVEINRHFSDSELSCSLCTR